MTNLATAILDSMATWERKESDEYLTPPNVTVALAQKLGHIWPGIDYIWEPACGNGDMAYVLERFGYEVFASDLRETGYGVQRDFLSGTMVPATLFDAVWRTERAGDMAIVTNPPFSHALEFMERALRYTRNVAMLHKSDFWNVARHYEFFKANTPQMVLPLTWRPAFLEEERGNSPIMTCNWTVWSEAISDEMLEDFEDPAPWFFPLPKPDDRSVPDRPLEVLLAHHRSALEKNRRARER